ncbi:hypothetical protein [Helicobacter labacensis]|uniref:hypothetical protein n=1 Tax=Helicobacter labacensis TaxID=2316079 RepID=UPI0013CE0C3F|nr:hypothetical protein [Helicobacter labacensis]
MLEKHDHLLTPEFKERFKEKVCVFHHKYLWGACKEVGALLDKRGEIKSGLLDAIVNIYNKKRNQHQAKFFLLQCFENALRSTMATILANTFNTNKDDWFWQTPKDGVQRCLQARIRQILHRQRKNIREFPTSTFDVFDFLYLSDLQQILEDYYVYFEPIFSAEKRHFAELLPVYGTKRKVIDTIDRIRRARNDIFHNKPTNIKFQRDLEILLLRLDFNLKETGCGSLECFLNLRFGCGEMVF